MGTGMKVGIVVGVILALIVVWAVVTNVSLDNQEVRLRNKASAQKWQ